MAITTVSSGEFKQNVAKVTRAAVNGPVFITDQGHPSYVLLTIENYQRLTDKQESLVELLAMSDGADIEFEPPRLSDGLYRAADLSE
jgi:prevent-host-death family protein